MLQIVELENKWPDDNYPDYYNCSPHKIHCHYTLVQEISKLMSVVTGAPIHSYNSAPRPILYQIVGLLDILWLKMEQFQQLLDIAAAAILRFI